MWSHIFTRCSPWGKITLGNTLCTFNMSVYPEALNYQAPHIWEASWNMGGGTYREIRELKLRYGLQGNSQRESTLRGLHPYQRTSLSISRCEDHTTRSCLRIHPVGWLFGVHHCSLHGHRTETISALGSFNRDHNSPGPFNRDHNSQGPVGCMLDMDAFTSWSRALYSVSLSLDWI